MKLSPVIIGILAATFVAVIAIIAWLTSIGANTSEIISMIMAGGAAVMAAIPGLKNHKDIQEVKTQTNGNNEKLQKRNETLEEENSMLNRRIGELENMMKGQDNGSDA